MRRREFIAGLCGTAAAWPFAVRAQQPTKPEIGFLSSTSIEMTGRRVTGFYQGLGEIGYVEGRNVAIEYRWAEGHYDRLPALATDLVRRQVAVIAALGGTPSAIAAKAATKTIPIVFAIGADPVEIGLVASLARPAGNMTGAAILITEVTAKRFELLHELLPSVTSIALLVNPASPISDGEIKEAQIAARILGVRLLIMNAVYPSDLPGAFSVLAQERAGAVVVSGDTLFNTASAQIAALAAQHALPIIAQYREYPEAGGLMSYGPVVLDAYRLVGRYTGRILMGQRPADLPVQQATKIELVLNNKTVKALGLIVPQSILLRADEVID